MIKYFRGTVFNSAANAIVNTINCTGVMGAGIALEFKLRFPNMYKDYYCKCKNDLIKVGFVDYYKTSDDTIIVNFPTKWHFKYPSKMQWIEEGLIHFAQTYSKAGITSVAFPKLGTGKGGLNWSDVKVLMEKHLSHLDIEVIICLDESKEAEGVESKMLDAFNSTNIEELAKSIKLSEKQKDNLRRNMPYKRFWQIADTPSIGIKTYSAIFNAYYSIAINPMEIHKQLSFFD